MNIQFSSGHSNVSPPDTAGQLGGASSLLSGAAAFSSETSGRPLAIELPELAFDVFVHRSPRLELAYDGERSEADGTERQNRNRNHLKVIHCNISVVQRDG